MEFTSLYDGIGIWVASFLTLAVFSFLYRDNPIYKAAEHLYVGIAAGYYFYQAFRTTIAPNLFRHVFEGIHKMNSADPAVAASGWTAQWRWGALVLGVLLLSRLVPKWAWISRWPMAVIVGAYAALNLVGYGQANLMDQINATFIPLAGRAPESTAYMPFWPVAGAAGEPSMFNHLVLVFGVISVLAYFLFSSETRGRLSWLQQAGITFVMVTFGATYGSIVLARVSLLIGRVQTLKKFNQPEWGYPPIVCAAVIIAALVVWRLKFFRPEDAPEE